MSPEEAKYYHSKFSALRTAIDEAIAELAEKMEQPAPGTRRNLKRLRIEKHEENFIRGSWSKPAAFKTANHGKH